ncbi:hypothetical protein TPY_1719 [Sulfobacillus acidophilus TPY]|uniref:Uncharacterized protein n=1 Tax=Sulfobacillus acidophilus (strain ATCC 700253 / DSM 10332 / NAL) TaxID=679936 RepID=G8U0V8_SULAD|nr:hypothetical protein TPY_1719 [Sulfobacillus acidophilus TPY]AEW05411.1 hypothetical protein Sulac_1919 [Sulfobacillus acidophilus DSM 10332]
MPRWRHWIGGASLLLMLELLLVYGYGLTVTVPPREIPRLRTLVVTAVTPVWPAWQAAVVQKATPALKGDIVKALRQTALNVGGIQITVPDAWQKGVADQLVAFVQTRLATTLVRQIRPGEVITPDVIRQILQNVGGVPVWVRLGPLPVPVRIRLGHA